MERMIVLGRFRSPFGVKGQIKVESFTDPPEALVQRTTWQVKRADGSYASVTGMVATRHGSSGLWVVTLPGVTSPEQARVWVNCEIAAARSQLPELPAGEYYWEDLRGCSVVTTEGRELGVVDHFLEFPANPVMVVKAGRVEHWLPLIKSMLSHVDLERRQMVVDWDPL